jgi:pyruvate dehydrogenase E2 component (dihydrolipoamide acetyltransferase)
MVSELAIPVMDQTTETVALIGWRKREGDAVAEGEVVCEIETDKATVEIAAPAAGWLRKILVQAGTQVPPRTVVALIAEADEPLPAIDPFYRTGQAQPPAPSAPAAPPPRAAPEPPSGQKAAVSPRARRLAEQHGIDLAQLRGSGPGGRILEEDVQRAVDQKAAAPPAASRAEHTKAERVSRSWQSIPHFYTSITIDLSRVAEAGAGAGVTFTDHFALAIVRTLAAHPHLNGHWVNDALLVLPEIRLGLVVETDHGLVIPALPDLRGLSLQQIAIERSRLVEQARGGRMAAELLSAPTFTLSNMGKGHIDQFTAIISPPQVAILSVGGVQPRPLVSGGALVARPSAVFTLGADHRAIDGREAGRFLEQLKTELEAAA